MNTVTRISLQSKPIPKRKSYYYPLIEAEKTSLIDFKFCQKLFVLLISLFIILIVPESPRELGNICESHNPRKICNVW